MSQPKEVLGTQAAYDAWSAIYDEDVNPTRQLDAQVLRLQSFVLEGRDVLELGCGTGKNTVWLAQRSKSLVCMDFSEGMLARARKLPGTDAVRFLQHDLTNDWPFQDQSFDVVVENLVLEHIENLRPVFREAARVLRPGGHFFLCELHPAKQYLGSQARFTDPATGTMQYVQAYVHDVSEFLDQSGEADLYLARLSEWRDDGATKSTPPRLLSLLLQRG